MKTLAGVILGFGVLVGAANAQTITGKVINTSGTPQEGKEVVAHLTIDGNYGKGDDITDILGDFNINNVTDVEDDQVQTNIIKYYSNNIELPKDATITICDILGQEVNTIKGLKGVNKLPTQNLADGVYFTQIKTNNEPIVNKFVTKNGQVMGIGKTTKEWKEVIKNTTMPKIQSSTLDSIVVSGNGIKTKTFQYGIPIGTNHDVGELVVEPEFVTINGQVIRLHRYNQPNNEVSNALVKIGNDSTFTDGLGNFSLIAPSGENTLIITHPEYYTRETLIKALSDTTIAEHIVKHEDIPANVYEFYNLVTGRSSPAPYTGTRRWKQPPTFYINVDTTTQDGLEKYLQQKAKIDTVLKELYKTPTYPEGFLKNVVIENGLNPPADGTPGFYIIRWEPNIGAEGLTAPYFDFNNGKNEIYSARTRYNTTNNTQTMEKITIKELSTGLSGMGRYNNIPSLWNVSVLWENRNGGPYDFQIVDWQYSRPGKNLIEDKDNGWHNWWEE